MEQIWEKALKTAAAVGGAIAGAFGGWDGTLFALIAMMGIDYVSGVAVAILGRSQKTEYGGLSSKVGAAGLFKKGLMLMVVLAAALLDRAMDTDICRNAACWFYIANEGLSLLENLTLAGVPFPRRLQELLGYKRDEADGEGEDDGLHS